MIGATHAYIGLGGNLGDARATVAAGAQALADLPQTRLVRVSRLYRTPAWGGVVQADFINAVALVETRLAARPLLQGLLALEQHFGRTRAADGSDRWGPRSLDLDLLLYGDETIDRPGLQVPHPHLHARAFALLPLLEIAPDVKIPGRGDARDWVDRLDTAGIEAVS